MHDFVVWRNWISAEKRGRGVLTCDGIDCNGYGNCSVCPKNLIQVFVCSGCGQPIYEGETYYEVLGEQFCSDCMMVDYRKEAWKVDESLF